MNKALFLGIDCSSKTIHIVSLKPNGTIESMKKFESKSTDFETRFNEVCEQFEEWFDVQAKHADYVAVIENPIYIQNIKVTNALNHVIAGTKRALHRNRVSYFAVDNRHWKKQILGNGASSKEQIMQFAKTKWSKQEFTEQDFCDAACIAFWGVQRFGEGK